MSKKISTNSKIALILSIISTICTICCCSIKAIPLSIIFSIFSLSFIYIQKKTGNKLNKFDILSIFLSIWGLVIGTILFLIILNILTQLQDPKFANEFLEKLIKISNDLNINFDFSKFKAY